MKGDVLEMVKRANPVEQERADAWAQTDAAARIRRQIEDETIAVELGKADSAPRTRRLSRGIRIAGLAAALLLVGGGIAGAAVVLFGRPAPEGVKRDLRGLYAGLPADIRLNPDVQNARSVAATDTSTLYYAELRDGGYCTEIVTGSRPRGANCTTSAQVAEIPIGVTVPTSEPQSPSTPVSFGGNVNASDATTLAIRYADGTEDPIPFGEGHFYVFDVPESKLAIVHRGGFELIARDASGTIVAHGVVPPDFDQVEPDSNQPIFVSTFSDHSDFTKVLGIEGQVDVDHTASLELVYPDGTTVDIPLRSNGTYRYDIPADRQDDLYPDPGELIARDREGHVLARTRVASVAYWRARERSGS